MLPCPPPFRGTAVWYRTVRRQVKSLLSDQDLAHGLAAYRAFCRILYVGDDSIPNRSAAARSTTRFTFGCPHCLKRSRKSAIPKIRPHHATHFFRFLLQRLQIAAEKLNRQFAFHAADRFLHVVKEIGCEKFQITPGLTCSTTRPWRRLNSSPEFVRYSFATFSRQQVVTKELRINKATHRPLRRRDALPG